MISLSHRLKRPKCQAVNCRWNFWEEPGGDSAVTRSKPSKGDAVFVWERKKSAKNALLKQPLKHLHLHSFVNKIKLTSYSGMRLFQPFTAELGRNLAFLSGRFLHPNGGKEPSTPDEHHAPWELPKSAPKCSLPTVDGSEIRRSPGMYNTR